MKQLILPLLFFSLIFSNIQLIAQPGDLRQDSTFFEKQKEIYQKWLDKSGLGKALTVREVEVEENAVAIYLAFNYNDLDSIVNAWDELERFYDEKEGLSLSQTLFYKWTNLIEVRQNLVNVQLYDTYDLRREPLFFRGIYYADGKVQVESSNPKSEIREIKFRPPNQNETKANTLLSFKQQMSREVVYFKILNHAKNRYERENCQDRSPKVVILENEEILRFEVLDLCKEVLIDESQPTLCGCLRAFGYDCNWVKREMLIFTVTHRETEEGVKLTIEIDGKYGSGIYEEVKRGGYISMEIDFDEYLERYADIFKEELKTSLK